jgi:hypothetical protein
MNTGYRVLYPDGAVLHAAINWPDKPCRSQVEFLVEEILGPGEVALHVEMPDDRRDMFVSALGHLRLNDDDSDGVPFNPIATSIYRANLMRARPGTDPETVPAIVGTAVVFDRVVW